MTRAAGEPQYAAPPAQRLGYLRHMIANLDIGSPDGLHGAAHLAPLAGLELPVLDMLADMNDAAIEAGAAADLEGLERVRRRTRQWLVAEADRLANQVARGVITSEGSPAEVLALLALQGEAITADVLLSTDRQRAASIASRLARVLETHGAHIPAATKERVLKAIDMLRTSTTESSSIVYKILDAAGLSPLQPG